jgi:predicted dinucleotide-binding enzyme
MKIGILGSGNVGKALSRGVTRAGHEVQLVHRDPAAMREAVEWADAVVLAIPFSAIDSVVNRVGSGFDGKVVVDVTNTVTPDMRFAELSHSSGAERLQASLPKAKVVKAFNTVFARHMDTGTLDGKKLTTLIAADDPAAKKTVMNLAEAIGFDAVDSGPLSNARMIESMAFLNIQLGYGLGMGTEIGFMLHHR